MNDDIKKRDFSLTSDVIVVRMGRAEGEGAGCGLWPAGPERRVPEVPPLNGREVAPGRTGRCGGRGSGWKRRPRVPGSPRLAPRLRPQKGFAPVRGSRPQGPGLASVALICPRCSSEVTAWRLGAAPTTQPKVSTQRLSELLGRPGGGGGQGSHLAELWVPPGRWAFPWGQVGLCALSGGGGGSRLAGPRLPLSGATAPGGLQCEQAPALLIVGAEGRQGGCLESNEESRSEMLVLGIQVAAGRGRGAAGPWGCLWKAAPQDRLKGCLERD